MANNLKKVSYLDNISPVSMTGTDLFYLVHSTGGVTTSYSLQLSDLFLGTNNLTTNIKFNSNSLVITSGKVGINTASPTVAHHVVGDSYVSANTTIGTSLSVGTSLNVGTTATIGTSATISNRTVDAFPSGTKMLFIQSSAPTGWVKLTAVDDAALRVVSGTASTGGSSGFISSLLAAQNITGTVGGTAITIAQMPSHSHNVSESPHVHTFPGDDQLAPWATAVSGINYSADSGYQSGGNIYNTSSTTTGLTINSIGGNEAHAHSLSINSLNLNVKYVDAIICQKS